MPEVNINIGGRVFEVACQEGEQPFLEAAAKILDGEASVMAEQLGRMPEAKMLLMAGLMLADKTVGTEDHVKSLEQRISNQDAMIRDLQSRPPERVEVPVIPPNVSDGLAELAARAESLAEEMEESAAS